LPRWVWVICTTWVFDFHAMVESREFWRGEGVCHLLLKK
jgi:hypothetical protein